MQETQETQVQSLGQDPLEAKMVTQSSILAQKIPWTEEPGGLQSTGSQRVGHNRGHGTHNLQNQMEKVNTLMMNIKQQIQPELCLLCIGLAKMFIQVFLKDDMKIPK